MPTPPATSDAAAAPARPPAKGLLRRTGEWCARHFVIVIVLWLAALAGLRARHHTYGGEYSDDFSLSGTQSQEGLDVLREHEPAAGGYSSQVVLHDGSEALTGVSSQISSAVTSLGKLPHVLSAQNPLPPPGTTPPPQPSGTMNVGPLSTDGSTAYITVRFDVQPSTLGDDYLHGVDSAVKPLRAAGVDAPPRTACVRHRRTAAADARGDDAPRPVRVVDPAGSTASCRTCPRRGTRKPRSPPSSVRSDRAGPRTGHLHV